VVVLGAHALRLRLMLGRAGVRVVTATNPDWASGLASSLRTGIAAVPRSAQAVLVTLVDQPQVDAAALRRLLAAWQRRPGAPAAAYYDGHAGVPAIVPRRHFRALRALQGDSGARALLRQAGELTVVELPEAALDIDTAADVARLR
jgi:molybdenum cofactor cytidylyltransferase